MSLFHTPFRGIKTETFDKNVLSKYFAFVVFVNIKKNLGKEYKTLI